METLSHSIQTFILQYQLLFLSGIVGAAAFRLQKSMTLSMFVKHILVSIFVSSMVCLVVKNFTSWSNDVIFVCGALSGYFSSSLIKEGNEIVESISDIVKNKFDNDNDKFNDEMNDETDNVKIDGYK